MTLLDVWPWGAAAAAFVVLPVWVASVAKRDVSIIDIFWGPGFAVLAWSYVALAGAGERPLLLAGLTTVWGLRLGVHIAARGWGGEEDYRYREMRESIGERFWWVSLFTVFLLQGALMWVISLPQARAAVVAAPLGPLDALGVVLFATGFTVEALADRQLTRFRADPSNAGQVLDSGLWRYSRHPNYFGDALLWWGIALVGLAAPGGWSRWVVLVSPALMSFLLMRVSGVTLLERRLEDVKPGYRDYVRRTSAFFPWPPSSAGSQE